MPNKPIEHIKPFWVCWAANRKHRRHGLLTTKHPTANQAPNKRHYTQEDAEAEAERLRNHLGCRVYVLQAVAFAPENDHQPLPTAPKQGGLVYDEVDKYTPDAADKLMAIMKKRKGWRANDQNKQSSWQGKKYTLTKASNKL